MCEWAFLFSFFRQTEERKAKSPPIYSRMAMQKSRGPSHCYLLERAKSKVQSKTAFHGKIVSAILPRNMAEITR